MALTKTTGSITQRTTTGQSTSITVSDSYGHTLYIQHVNGTGTISAGAVVVVQVQPTSGTRWYNLTTYRFGTTASATETKVCPLPEDAAAVRLDYTAPSGSTGHTLDAESGEVTALL